MDLVRVATAACRSHR
ncbi:hypothetical protein [Rhodococcus sp. CH91]